MECSFLFWTLNGREKLSTVQSRNLVYIALVKSQAKREDVVCLRTNRLRLTTEPPQKLVVDGELCEANPIEFECIPGGLTIFAPISTV